MKQQLITSKQRLVGIDLFRGVSAYAVILIHTGTIMLYSGLPTNDWTTKLVEFSRFAVPFFLASSFYLMTTKLYTNKNQISTASSLKARFRRLLIPYFFWSLIYLSLRIVKALSSSDDLNKLFQDPVLLIFLGGASIHLYFMPLLFTGSFLIILAEFIAKKGINLKIIIFSFILSTIIYELQIISGNAFEFSTQFGINCLEHANSCSVAFDSFTTSAFPNANNIQLIRLILVELSWLIICLPYVFIAMIINHPDLKNQIDKFNIKHGAFFLAVTLLLSILGLMNTSMQIYFPLSLYEIGIASSLLLAGISISAKLGNNSYIENLGICSFGIYLMHYLILNIYVVLVSKMPIKHIAISPVLIMLFLTTLSFLTSWVIASSLVRRKSLSKVLFGI